MKTTTINNISKIESGVNTNDNSNNNKGDDVMNQNKGEIKILSKKAFKSLSKSQAYNVYESIAEVANGLRIKTEEALKCFEEAKQHNLVAQSMVENVTVNLEKIEGDMEEFQRILVETESELADTKSELASTKSTLADTESTLASTESELADTKSTLADTESTLASTESKLASTESTLADTQNELTDTQDELADTQDELANTKLELAESQGRNDAGFDITHKVQDELDRMKESITDDYEVYDDCADELSTKAKMINHFRNQMKFNRKEIRSYEHDIKLGVAVNFNRKMIRDLEAQNRYLQNQINCFQVSFNDFKSRKTAISETIDSKRTDYEKLEESWKIVSESIGL